MARHRPQPDVADLAPARGILLPRSELGVGQRLAEDRDHRQRQRDPAQVLTGVGVRRHQPRQHERAGEHRDQQRLGLIEDEERAIGAAALRPASAQLDVAALLGVADHAVGREVDRQPQAPRDHDDGERDRAARGAEPDRPRRDHQRERTGPADVDPGHVGGAPAPQPQPQHQHRCGRPRDAEVPQDRHRHRRQRTRSGRGEKRAPIRDVTRRDHLVTTGRRRVTPPARERRNARYDRGNSARYDRGARSIRITPWPSAFATSGYHGSCSYTGSCSTSSGAKTSSST